MAWSVDGVSANRETLLGHLRVLANAGARVVRWFVVADGRALDGDALHPQALVDLEAALSLAEEAGVQLLPVVLDYLWFDSPKVFESVQMFGRTALAREPARLLDEVILPLVAAFPDDERIYAWDLINEPEWAIAGPQCLVGAPLEKTEMLELIEKMLVAVRGHCSRPMTLGSASVSSLRSLWLPLDLDMLQYHHYGAGPLEAVDDVRPLIIGEVPSRRTRELAPASAEIGCAAYLPWALLSDDEHTDAATMLAELAQVSSSR